MISGDRRGRLLSPLGWVNDDLRPIAACSVLFAGASTGIGLVVAHQLLTRGWQLLRAARRVEAIEFLQSQGAHELPLDVAEAASLLRLAATVQAHVCVLDALVNNAGDGELGPLETMSFERARAIVDVNVFGLMELIQLLLLAMRYWQRGRIDNVSSIAGGFVTPGAC